VATARAVPRVNPFPTAVPGPDTSVEILLRRGRLWILAGLVAACLMCWAWIVPMALDMYGPMHGASLWMMADTPLLRFGALLFAMWVVMMAGMMLPSAAPTLLLFAMVVRSHDTAHAPGRVYSFLGGYLLVWTAFSLAATLLQLLLGALLYLSPMMQLRGQALSGALVLVAGAYQLTPIKRSCLATCRAPAAFLARYYRPGNSFGLGVRHGGYCVGCCWALMLLLFVAGVMNLAAIAAIAVFVLLEKVMPLGAQGGRLSGLLLIVCGALLLLR
jgi:predicted metal-binding membrane protein